MCTLVPLKGSAQSSTPPNHTYKSLDSPLSDAGSSRTTEDGASSDKSRGWLQFHPVDFLSRGKKSNSDNSFSPILKTSGNENRKRKGESQIEKADKVYTVAAKDISMLERISQKAQERALRIQKHHEVGVVDNPPAFPVYKCDTR